MKKIMILGILIAWSGTVGCMSDDEFASQEDDALLSGDEQIDDELASYDDDNIGSIEQHISSGFGELNANRTAIGPWEQFKLVDRDGDTVALRSYHGRYVVAEGGGGGAANANRTAIGPWEQFTLVQLGNGLVTLRTYNGHYVVAEGGGGGDLNANRTAIGPWEQFTLVQLGNELVALRTYNGHYVVAEGGGGEPTCDTSRLAWCTAKIAWCGWSCYNGDWWTCGACLVEIEHIRDECKVCFPL